MFKRMLEFLFGVIIGLLTGGYGVAWFLKYKLSQCRLYREAQYWKGECEDLRNKKAPGNVRGRERRT
jgi:hypothetical protein